MKEKQCPRCSKYYSDYPAISRKDNKTEICPDCSLSEAFEAMNKTVLRGDK